MMDILVQLGVNHTLWVQLVIFTVVFLIMRALFFKPFLDVILEREAQTDGVTKTADELNKNADAMEKEFHEKMQAVKKQASEQKEDIVSKAKSAANEKTNDARKQHKDAVEASRKKIEDDLDEALSQLKGRVHGFAQLFVEKLTKVKY